MLLAPGRGSAMARLKADPTLTIAFYRNVEAMRKAIEKAGIEFVFDEEGKSAGIFVRGARITGRV